MRAFVFTDRALERQAGRFVWLSINAEKEANAAFLERYPIQAYPTLMVLDPAKEEAAFRWLGGASVAQLEKLLEDGERALGTVAGGTEAALAEADRLMGAGKNREAAKAYEAALGPTPAGPRRDRVVESLLTALGMTDSNEECVRIARQELPAEKSAHFANVATSGLGCALSLEGDAKAEAVAHFETAVREAAADRGIEMAADDRSGLFLLAVSARKDAKDDEGAKTLANDWLAFLDGEAGRAPTPEKRAVFDPHRLSAAIDAGIPDRAIPFLSQSEKDFPKDYNPPARLAIAYRELGRYPEALSAADRALALAYGPRKLRVYAIRSEILEKMGDRAAAVHTLEEAVEYATGLPKSQLPESAIDGLRGRIAKMNGATPS